MDRVYNFAAGPSTMPLEALETAAREMKVKTVTLKVRAGDNGRLYGSITTQEIADALKAQHGVDVDKRKIEVDGKVTSVGQTTITIKLYAGVATKMNLVIEAAGK